MESGGEMDRLYSLEQNFGNRQYISPNSQDLTEISYGDKLKKHLEAVLLSDETAKRVRAAFDAYVFLSYRKKDRALANTLMRIIHSIPGCRDIAIWYDEFLTPGESFIQNIERAMEKSSLFTLLVTPNLLEEGNFVMTEEYPAAKRSGMDILPTEMVKTDRNLLVAKFDELPEPVKADDEHFSEALLSVIKKIAISENDSEPEHNFLIGLAYLDGIDVEVDVERGIELIKKAAEGGLREAINKLVDMYTYGYKVEVDYEEALRWASFPDIPADEIKGVRVGYQGVARWVREFREWDINFYKDINLTPEMLGQSSNPTVEEGEELYMMVGELADDPRNTPEADHLLIANGYVSVVAHNIDCTDYEVLDTMRSSDINQDF